MYEVHVDFSNTALADGQRGFDAFCTCVTRVLENASNCTRAIAESYALHTVPGKDVDRLGGITFRTAMDVRRMSEQGDVLDDALRGSGFYTWSNSRVAGVSYVDEFDVQPKKYLAEFTILLILAMMVLARARDVFTPRTYTALASSSAPPQTT